MNQLPYQQTQNALIQNQNQTSLYPIQPIGIPQNNIIQDNIKAVQYKNLLEELSQSTSAEINTGPRSNKECFEDMFGCINNKTFVINLTTKNGTRQAFACKENTGTCQRYFCKAFIKNCAFDIFYNTAFSNPSFPNYDFSAPYIRATRTNGGCCHCHKKGILNAYYVENHQLIGSIVENKDILVDIKDISNNLKYLMKYDVKVEKKCFCFCCTEKTDNLEELKNLEKFTIYQGDQPVGFVKWRNMTLPINASPEDKLLLILGRIFVIYLNDNSRVLSDYLLD